LKALIKRLRDSLFNSSIAVSQMDRLEELLKSQAFCVAVANTNWIKNKVFYPGRWAADYSLLLTLYRALEEIRPANILEFGLGETSKLIHQYADFEKGVNAITIEHDNEWINSFKDRMRIEYKMEIVVCELEEVTVDGFVSKSYKSIREKLGSIKYDLIIIDGPFGSDRFSRPSILYIADKNIADDFCIIFDDMVRKGEQDTFFKLVELFQKNGKNVHVAIHPGVKRHGVICSDKFKFMVTI